MSNIGSESVTINHALDDQSQVSWVVSIVGLACAISTTAVCLRLFTRLRILHIFGPDDAFMGIAQLIAIGAAVAIGLGEFHTPSASPSKAADQEGLSTRTARLALSIPASSSHDWLQKYADVLADNGFFFPETKWGLGRHKWVMKDGDYTPYMKSFYASVITYNVGVCVVKISIMLQYRRIFTGPVMQKMTMALLIFESCWATTLSILLPLVCNPVSMFWDTSVEGTCLDQLSIWYVMASINLVTDFIVFSMPLPVIKSLQLPKRQKIMLMGVFCLGFFTCIISVYRMQTLKTAAHTGDATWDNTDAAVWSYIELTIGVLAASLPTLKPLFARLVPRLFKSTVTSQYRYNNQAMSGRNTANLYGKSHTRTRTSTAGGGMFIKDIDGDLNALRTHGSRASAGSFNGGMELPIMYNVTVTGGKRRDSVVEHTEEMSRRTESPEGGIQTTTVVTQRVDSL